MVLWHNSTETQFFIEALKSFATREQLFYHLQNGYFAYVPMFEQCKSLIETDMNYFSSMISKSDLGSIIKISSQENIDIASAEKFLTLIRS